LKGRCDSFVVETDVHYPTDITLLWDAMRTLSIGCGRLSPAYGWPGWRKYRYNLRQLKRWLRRVQRLKHASTRDEQKQAQREQAIRCAYQQYLEASRRLVARAEATLAQWPEDEDETERATVARFVHHAHRQIDQIERRGLQGETIPHDEKIFSLFEEHTEWIRKGKAGVPVELGLNVCVLEDQYGFILHHRVMQGERDEAVAVPMVEQTQARFPALKQCSFDANFYTPDNRQQLRTLLERAILPSKGARSPEEDAWETSAAFVRGQRQHAAVESAIHALEVHGLDRCPDHGLDGFQRYVALAVVARNIQQLGAWLQKKAKATPARRRSPQPAA
jgi:hypothetical protein